MVESEAPDQHVQISKGFGLSELCKSLELVPGWAVSLGNNVKSDKFGYRWLAVGTKAPAAKVTINGSAWKSLLMVENEMMD